VSDRDCFLRRAAEELAAAERATCSEARRVHHELAHRYLLKIERDAAVLEFPSSGSEGRLSA
jgi:hypothetical protein